MDFVCKKKLEKLEIRRGRRWGWSKKVHFYCGSVAKKRWRNAIPQYL
tara:strand:- start:552 stop:692 length:141 start_codon:yes stop_codon:yes gene_type:complete